MTAKSKQTIVRSSRTGQFVASSRTERSVRKFTGTSGETIYIVNKHKLNANTGGVSRTAGKKL
jgi:hypothetical protein